MDHPRLIRGLRIAVSAVCGIACFLTGFMWYRSIRSMDAFAGCTAAADCVSILSDHGGVALSVTGSPNVGALLQVTTLGNVDDELQTKMEEFYKMARELRGKNSRWPKIVAEVASNFC